MKLSITLLILLSMNSNFIFGQIDTIQLSQEINSLKSIEDHKKFWKQVYADDQKFRGKQTNDNIDCLNLIKCSIYLNRFGYPIRSKLGSESQILSYVWIHNKYPRTDFITFPIIMEGFKAKQIDEEDFREYYFRSIYENHFSDTDYKEKSISELLKKLQPRIVRPINIKEVIETIEKEETFLYASHEELGIWVGEAKFDTLYLNNNAVINEITSTSIRLFLDNENNYFYHRLYDDGSHYPQKLITVSKNTFKLFEQLSSYLKLEEDGSLKLVNEDGSYERYTTENNK